MHSHTGRTSRRLPALSHAFDFALPFCLRLAYHVVIVERLASVAYEECSTEQRSRAGTDLFDFRDGFWKWGCIDEYLLVESVSFVSWARLLDAFQTYLGCRAAIVLVGDHRDYWVDCSPARNLELWRGVWAGIAIWVVIGWRASRRAYFSAA